MELTEKPVYWQALSEAASRLIHEQPSPLNLVKLCGSLNIRITRSVPPGKAKAALVSTPAGFAITLPHTDSETLGREERFLIAHEIGHAVLAHECSAVPSGKSEYWQHEELCDGFAGLLLVPNGLLKSILGDKAITAGELLECVNRVASIAVVPWRIAATRVSQFYPSAALFKAKLSQADEFKITVSSLPNKKEVGRKISVRTSLGRILLNVRGRQGLVSLDPSVFQEPVIPICQGAVAGALFASGNEELRLGVFLRKHCAVG